MYGIVSFVLLIAAVDVIAAVDTPIIADEMVVTATRAQQKSSDVLASVTVITQADIEALPARNVDDVLRHVRGISVLQPTGMGYGLPSQINIRGVPGQNSTLLLVDGMPLNEAGSGFVNINEVPLADIKQIEVVRGAYSAIYGADAFGGVINIITRDPEDTAASSVSVEMGNEGYTRVSAQASTGTRAAGLIVSVQKRSIDNYLAHDEQVLSYWDWPSMQYIEYSKDVDNFDYEDENISLKGTYDIGETAHLVLHGRYFGSELGYGTASYAPVYLQEEDSIMENRSVMGGASLELEISEGSSAEFRAFYREQSREVWGLDLSHMQGEFPVYVRSYSETVTDDWRIDGILHQQLGESSVVSVGADYYVINYDFEPLKASATGTALPLSSGSEGDIYNVGVYVQDQMAVLHNLDVVAGVRLDSHSEFNEAVSPKLGMLYKASDDTAFRASVGRAYRAPTALELFQPAVRFGPITFESNPDLDPEYIISADIGVNQRLCGAADGYVGLFYNDMDDLISKQISGSSLVYQNVDKAWSAGVEAGIDYAVTDALDLFANYTYQQSENETSRNDLENTPDHIASLGLNCRGNLGRFPVLFSVIESYRGERGYLDLANGMWVELDGYFRTDASVRLDLGQSFYMAVNVQNATDESYQEWQLINPAPGRLYAFELGAQYW
jgi:outer membrane cobalamin receptor